MSGEALRVLLVDDHEEFRAGLAALLAAADGCEVVGSAADGRTAVAMALDLQPDVILMDLHMPQLNGIEATARIVQSSPHISVVVLTMMEDDDSVFAAVRAGARGYLLKGARRQEIVRAIQSVGAGEVIFGPGVADRVMTYFSTVRLQPTAEAFPDLTDREREVLGQIAQGRENAEIARALGLSVKTVRNHASNIFAKLQVAHRAQAIVRAREAGLGRGDLDD
jgi:DNA-binding NarL/FixJ family response regulator